jgi:hypothetical protein
VRLCMALAAVPLFYMHQKLPEAFATTPEFLYALSLRLFVCVCVCVCDLHPSYSHMRWRSLPCLVGMRTPLQREAHLVQVAVRHRLL